MVKRSGLIDRVHVGVRALDAIAEPVGTGSPTTDFAELFASLKETYSYDD
jgi:hypothetical protein